MTANEVKEYMARHECGLLQAKKALRFKSVRDGIDQFQWNGSRDALSSALRELTDLLEGK